MRWWVSFGGSVCFFVALLVCSEVVSLWYCKRRFKGSARSSSSAVSMRAEVTFTLLNGTHALLSSILSSWALFAWDAWLWRDVSTAGRDAVWLPPLVAFTVGYMVVEMTYLALCPARGDYLEFLGFHAVILAGLTSFLVTGQGGLVALWGIWGEITATLLNVESLVEIFWHLGERPPGRGYLNLCLLTTLSFIIQRPILISALLVLTLQQFVWSISFVIQSCLLVGILFYNVDYLRDRFHFLRSTRALVGKIERRNARAAQLAFQRPANTDKNPP